MGQGRQHRFQGSASTTTADRHHGRPSPDNAVAASLEGRRPDMSYGRNSETRITWPGGTSLVRIKPSSRRPLAAGRARSPLPPTGPGNRSSLLEMAVSNRTPRSSRSSPPGSCSLESRTLLTRCRSC